MIQTKGFPSNSKAVPFVVTKPFGTLEVAAIATEAQTSTGA